MQLEKMLSGGDLRSIGQSNAVVAKIKSQNDFDDLFKCLFHKSRLVVKRAADAIEKITISSPNYLAKHKKDIFKFCSNAKNKELKWHLALLLSRFHLEGRELNQAWTVLSNWARDKKNSRIVRVNSIQSLFELLSQNSELSREFYFTLNEIEREHIPSINARIRIIKKISAK